jgi:hypothetical protein
MIEKPQSLFEEHCVPCDFSRPASTGHMLDKLRVSSHILHGGSMSPKLSQRLPHFSTQYSSQTHSQTHSQIPSKITKIPSLKGSQFPSQLPTQKSPQLSSQLPSQTPLQLPSQTPTHGTISIPSEVKKISEYSLDSVINDTIINDVYVTEPCTPVTPSVPYVRPASPTTTIIRNSISGDTIV